MKTEFEGEDLPGLGKKCKEAKVTSIKDCYENAYEIIVDPKAGKGG